MTTTQWWLDSPSHNSVGQRSAARDREHDQFMAGIAERQAERSARKKRLRPSDVVTRAAVAEVLRPFENGRGGQYLESGQQVAERIYSGCLATMGFLQRAAADPVKVTSTGWVQRAAVSPAATTTAGWAAELIETAVADFLADTPTPSAFAQLSELSLQVPQGALVKLPSRTHPITPIGAWIGEGQPKPVYALNLTSTTLSPNRCAVLCAWTQELADFGLLSVERLVKDSVQHDLRALLDTTLLDANAATATRPAGLFNSATAVTPTASGTATEKMVADIKNLTAAVMLNAPDAQPALIAHPNQAVSFAAAMLPSDFGITLISSGYMTAGNVGAVDLNSIAVMVGDLVFAVSTDATVHMDSVPAAIGIAGTPNVVSAPTISLFQADMVGLRSVLTASWAKRRTGCTALAVGVAW